MKRKIVIAIACAALAVIFVVDSAGISRAVFESITLCLNTVIPSLFAFLVLATFAMSSGLIRGEKSILLLSIVGGYPVGAKLLADRGFSQKKAAHMMMYCYCGSPVFLIALHPLGFYIWLSNAIACVVFAVFAARNNHTALQNNGAANTPHPTFVDSVTSAGKTMLQICAMVISFGVIIRVTEFLGVTSGVIFATLEITNIMSLQVNPALIAALTSIGGICIIFQIRAIVGGKFPLRKFLLARLPIAGLSSGICYLMTRSMAVETIARDHVVLVSAGGSVVASACLVVMTLLLLSSARSRTKT